MTPPEREGRESFWPMLAVVGAAVVCCAGPVVVALAAATGLGVVLARSGPYLAVGAAGATALVIAAVFWRRCRSCASPGVPAASCGRESSRGAHDGTETAGRVGQAR
jgi:hypothetical protein